MSKYKIHSYQHTGAQFLVERTGAILGDACGLGKTLQSILACQLVGAKAVLIVTLKSLKPWWVAEIVNVLDCGGVETDGKTFVNCDTIKFRISHYEEFRSLRIKGQTYHQQPAKVTRELLATPWDVFISDEVHSIKNPKAQRGRWTRKVSAKRRWGLTATPVAEYPQDLWGVLNWAAPKNFPHKWPFLKAYCTFMYNPFSKTMQPEKLDESKAPALRVATAPFLLVRRVEDVGMELPPLTIQDVPLVMPAAQRKLYDKIKTQTIIDLENETPGILDFTRADVLLIQTSVAARFTNLQRTTSHPAHFQKMDGAKLTWLRERLANGGEPAIIFTRFRETADRIREIVSNDYVVGTYAGLSHGHNLQFLNHVVAWDLPFERLYWEQALGRAHRQGQTKPVFVERLLCQKTCDESLAAGLDAKQDTVDLILAWLRGLKGN